MNGELFATEPLPPRAEIVVVGAGVVGLSIAYQLARRGATDLVILERGYLAEGASGRNGGGIRQQWSTESHVRLMQESVKLCHQFATELGVNIWFRQGGYLFLARSERDIRRLERTVEVQRKCGLQTQMLEPSDAAEVVPELNTACIRAACYNPSDGILFPWPFLWGYARQAVERGALLYNFTEVRDMSHDGGEFAIETNRGTLRAKRVINAAGAWSPQVAAMIDVEIPTHPIRHEICSSEPLKPFLGPMVSDLGSGLYFSQSMRGEIVGGVSLTNERSTYDMNSTLAFLSTYSSQLLELMPILGDIKVLRQWAGPYDVSPDGNPILGAPVGCPEFYLACGFVGHGFMMAPVIGKLYAEWLTGEGKHEIFDEFAVSRFTSGRALAVEDFNIG